MSEPLETDERSLPASAIKAIGFLAVLYLFFLCIELFGASFKLFGAEAAKDLLAVTDNPMVGLLIGILATSLMQSSSTTTSIIVGMVATGTLTTTQAVPMVMGANIGTTITAAIVSMGHLRRRGEFSRAFAGAVVHDFFNLCAVILFLPLEIAFHPIERTAHFLSEGVIGLEGAKFKSPLKAIVKPVVKLIEGAGESVIANKTALGVILTILALAMLIFALSRMVKIMGGALAHRLEAIVDRFLFTSTARALAVGVALTAVVQSSSVTTSLVIPLIGAGIVSMRAAYPYMVGANIGTTLTALLASLVTGSPAAVTIAICHLTFNVFGTAVFLPLKEIPIRLAEGFGRIAAKRRWMAPLYVGVVFFVIPGLFVVL